MRIKEKIKKTGYFWLPSTPKRKIPGALIIRDGGNIELEVHGLFNETVKGIKKCFINRKLGRIVGEIEDFGLVTLDGCFYRKPTVCCGGISPKSLIHVNRALLGIAYDKKEEILFDTFKFSVEGIDEWVGITGIRVKYFEDGSVSIKYFPPKEIVINLSNDLKLLIIFSLTGPEFPCTKEAKITQKIYFKLISEQELSLEKFISLVYKVTTFLSFAIDQPLCLEQVSATYKKLKNNNTPVPVSIYYPSSLYTESKPQIDLDSMLFKFNQVKDRIDLIINGWFNIYNTIEPALNLYFSAKTKAYKYLTGNFLALVQALESYHRRTLNREIMDDDTFKNIVNKLIEHCPKERQEWLSEKLYYANEISLAQRIKDIIKPFKSFLGTNNYRKRLIRKIVDTRNYLTHHDESLKSKAAVGRDLWLLCLKMEVIFQLQLLQLLGFTQEQIEDILKNNRKLQEKITGI